MRRLIAHGCVVVSVAMLCSGCTSYATVPTINEHAGTATQEIISSFSYKIDSPWKNSRLGKDAYALTKNIIPNAQDLSSSPVASSLPALEIKVSEFSLGGACTQEYLTGLSFGLIPSWCTRPDLFKFDFILNKENGVCRQRTYSVSATTVSHLVVIPFALLQPENRPLGIYQASLRDFLKADQCSKGM
ncbi:hypothetical protein HUW52_16905 [Pseudomonas sp. 43A]|uniref:hypothetical protein n=1 Tax=unclassified Pseudomonas TaxID=196821 RepID=UPI001587826C|nr:MULTISPECIES: hypothetical protein [unclassified Pseudomonas]QKV64503.1 hypothetical protein HUW52_16905 [Pseudomonas sp. 43A]QMW07353.1 hypothetical protein H3303_15795 [Pseudomonas sp. 29A]